MSDDRDEILARCAFFDLEVDAQQQVRAAGAVFGERELRLEAGSTAQKLDALARFVAGAEFLVGHNVLWHDLPCVARMAPASPLLRMRVLDTLLLSPLAFPRRPYHALVKDYKLLREARNDPVADAKLTRAVLLDELAAISAMPAALRDVIAWGVSPRLAERGAATGAPLAQVAEPLARYGDAREDDDEPALEPRATDHGGHAALLAMLGATRCDDEVIQRTLDDAWGDHVCARARHGLVASRRAAGREALEVAFAAAWLHVADSDSILPGWVRAAFPGVRALLATLRDSDCGDASCAYCAREHAAVAHLQRWFKHDEFRPQPAAPDGSSLQRRIVECGLRSGSLLGILPTGGGKSLCFQLPAIARYRRTGAMTVVLSPLQALMKDQVEGLERRTGHRFAVALNGLLTPPERRDAMERVREGDVALLYLSPEQLRSPSCTRLLAQREIAAWVFDEAHCLAKWGHDFRPDYLYAARFIKEQAARDRVPVPPIACLTATARREVRDEILAHFRDELGVTLELFEGGVRRDNLAFAVELLPPAQKDARIRDLVDEQLAIDHPGAVIVYCARRKDTEALAGYLKDTGIDALAYHAGLTAAERKERQTSFMDGVVRVICATNAFGMGIDKDDVRLVVHAQMPASLENYLQEAGRAGRDGKPARCVLLHAQDDVEQQFRLIASSRLDKMDLVEIWKALHRKRKRDDAPVVATAGEILRDEETRTTFDADQRDAPTRVATAVAWLERRGFLRRNENLTSATSARLNVRDLTAARALIAQANLDPLETQLWEAICLELLRAPPDQPVDADAIAGLPAFRIWEGAAHRAESRERSASVKVLRVLRAMAKHGLVNTSTNLTAFVRDRVVDPSHDRLKRALAIESALLELLRDLEPDADQRPGSRVSLRGVNARLVDGGIASDVQRLGRTLRSLDRDTFEQRPVGGDEIGLRLKKSWSEALAITRLRQRVAVAVLDAIFARIDKTQPPRKDQLVQFDYEDLEKALANDLFLRGELRDVQTAIERALVWLNEQEVILLQGGLSVFLRAMTFELVQPRGKQVTKDDYAPLAEHYRRQQDAVHVVERYAEQGATAMPAAQRLVADYFTLPGREFLRSHFAGEQSTLACGTSAKSYRRIVDDLRNDAQQAIVTAPEEQNLLVLAGPGSGKTRVVVHRCAYLLRVLRVPPRSILLLCFNRSTAHELRKRLRALAGDDARFVTIATYHGFAMRLCGRSFAAQNGSCDFDALIEDAIDLLEGKTPLAELEPDEQRDELLRGYRFILVDEYQDIDERQYRLVSAIAGRTRADPEERLALFAVGDDDQSIYGWREANVAFIRRFEKDYHATRHELLTNYRSTAAIVAASNQLIAANRDRMKSTPIRAAAAPSTNDARVQVLRVATPARGESAQALTVVDEIARRLEGRCAQPGEFAVLALRHETLALVRAIAEARGIEVRRQLEKPIAPSRIREVAAWLDALAARAGASPTIDAAGLRAIRDVIAAEHAESPWLELIDGQLDACLDELGGEGELALSAVREFILDALAEERRARTLGRGVELRTIHGAKGLEFEHVLLCDEGISPGADAAKVEEERRLFYVGMTRARRSLTVVVRPGSRAPHSALLGVAFAESRAVAPGPETPEPGLLARRFELLGLDELFLDFAGRRRPGDQVHEALRSLRSGDALRVVDGEPRLRLLAPSGVPVGELDAKASELWRPRLPQIEAARVVAVLRRERQQCSGDFAAQCKVDRWEIPLVELVFAAAPGSP
ncbi:MAG: RecQ family ATP-dependent DNA helicase [Planctomycetes bacterium]|nr:RecQ family ATP-dependent DNA helicase [Planctomycetota bacterium]